MNEIIHPFDCDCDRCTTHDEDGNEVHYLDYFEGSLHDMGVEAEDE